MEGSDMRLIFATIPAAFFAFASLPAAASPDESYDVWEMRQVMKAELDRARERGGYPDPITALIQMARGTADEDIVVPAYSDIYDLPGYEATPINPTQPQN